MSIDAIVDRAGGDPLYVRFLLIEYPYIRSALYARGVCLDEEYQSTAHSPSIGNALHNDIIELEMWLSTLSEQDRGRVFAWANASTDRRPPFSRPQLRRIRRMVERFGESVASE